MAPFILIVMLINMCIQSNRIITVHASRADLGTYLHIKEMPGAEEKAAVDSYVLAYINYTYNTTDGKEIHFSEEKARYGEGRIMNVQGLLVHVTSDNDINDHTGCTYPLRGTKGQPLPIGKPWIALIKRGGCTFEEKIKYAWRQRASGVIVYNEDNSVSLEKMKIIEKDRNITAVFTFKWIGEEMAKIVEEGHTVWISLIEGQRGRRPLVNINKTSVLFVSVSFIVLMTISLVWLVFYYIQRFRYLQSKDQHSRHLCTVAKRIIMKIPTKSGKCDDKDSENDCCAICIEPYKATDCIRVLPCNHEFHKNCIDPWLLEHRTCPMCKLDVLKHYGFVVGDSQKLSSTSTGAYQAAQNNESRHNNRSLNSSSNNHNENSRNSLSNILVNNDLASNSSSNSSNPSIQANLIVVPEMNSNRNSNTYVQNSVDTNFRGFTTGSRQVTDV